MKHILFVMFNLPISKPVGSCTYTIGAMTTLIKKGFKVSLICNQSHKSIKEELIKLGINYIEVRTPRLHSWSNTLNQDNKYIYYKIIKQTTDSITKLHMKDKIDIINFQHLIGNNIIAYYVKHTLGIKTLGTSHGTETYELKDSALTKTLKALEGFDWIISTSPIIDNEIVNINPSIRGKNIISFPGINTPFNTKTNIKKNQDIVTCLFVGRLIKEKGIEEIINRYLESIEKIGIKTQLLVVGEGNLKKQLINQYKYNFHIKFLGKKSIMEIAEIMHKSDIFLFGSTRNEPFGMVLTEAMSCGLPIISTNVGIVKKILGSSYKGISTNWDEYSQNIKIFIKDIKLRNHLGKYLRSRTQQFQRNSIIDQLLYKIDEK